MKGASHQVLHRWLIFSLCSLLLWPQCSALFLPWPCGRAVCWLSAPSPSFIHILLVAPDSQEKPWNSYPFSNQQRCWSRQFLLPLSDTSTGNQAQLWDLEEGLTDINGLWQFGLFKYPLPYIHIKRCLFFEKHWINSFYIWFMCYSSSCTLRFKRTKKTVQQVVN